MLIRHMLLFRKEIIFFPILTKSHLHSLSEIMEDSDVISQINNAKHIEKNKPTQSFIFSLKNRVGGLARALRVFEVNFSLNFKTN